MGRDGKVATFLLVTGIVISLITYLYYTSYIILYSWQSLPAGIREIPIPFFTPTKNLLALISVAVSVLIVFSILVYSGRGPFSRMSSSSDREQYSIYAATFIASMLVVSIITSALFPTSGNYASIVLNFTEHIGVVTLTFILQVVPITIFSVIFAGRSKQNARDILTGNARLDGDAARFVFVASLIFDSIVLYLVNGLSGYGEWLFLFTVSNVLYLKFGLWRTYLANFLFTSMLVISYVVLFSFILSVVFQIFIFVWALAGLFILTNRALAYYAIKKEEEIKSNLNLQHTAESPPSQVQESRAENVQEHKIEVPDQNIVGQGKQKLWVKGGCPSCGNPTFNSDKNAILTCQKCGREIGIDEEHPHNIEIRNGRIIVSMQSDDNEDLYS